MSSSARADMMKGTIGTRSERSEMPSTAVQSSGNLARFRRLLQRVSASWPSADEVSALEVDRLRAAADAVGWIQVAHARAGDGGVSKGYDLLRGTWAPSYPETTGYTITTLLNAAAVLERPDLHTLAISLADYLLGVRTSEGGVSHWAARTPHPIVFDTGQVLFGWLAAFKATGEQRFLDASVRAGAWLVSAQDANGSWTANQHLGVAKVIDTRVSWALLELARVSGDDSVRQAARRNLDWAVTQQEADGWFRQCSFTPAEDPYTHTIAYTAEGLYESGLLLDEPRYLAAARLTADALLVRQQADGHLPSTFAQGWQETSRSCCLTGNCQMSRLWLMLHQQTGNDAYRSAARLAVAFVAWTRAAAVGDPEIEGGIAGSFPIQGRYERFKYPNWAAKFFIDAVLALHQFETRRSPLIHVG